MRKFPQISVWLARLWLMTGLAAGSGAVHAADAAYGFLFDAHKLTLSSGLRQEALGPLFSFQTEETREEWGLHPLFSLSRDRDPDLEALEWDFLYPLMSHDRFGREYRWHFFQLLSFSGGANLDDQAGERRRFSLFPFVFYGRSQNPADNYTAFFPFYGHTKKRFLRDEIRVVMAPFYVQTRKRDVVTDNYLYPFFHLRRGDHLRGWQLWPFYGHETREAFARTDSFGDAETAPGHEKRFILWPFFLEETADIGGANPRHTWALLPFYSAQRSAARDSTSYLWPLGLTLTDDRAKKYREIGAPWPLVVFARGEGKTCHRVFPLFSFAHTPTHRSEFLLWPLYKRNSLSLAPLERDRLRILFFLYSDTVERNTETREARRLISLWPLFTHREELNGNRRFQLLAPLEPLLPNNKSVQRNYSPLWSLWRAEKNAATGETSQSLLWNLYRHETGPTHRQTSLLFGLWQNRSTPEGSRTRLFFIPLGKSRSGPGAAPCEKRLMDSPPALR